MAWHGTDDGGWLHLACTGRECDRIATTYTRDHSSPSDLDQRFYRVIDPRESQSILGSQKPPLHISILPPLVPRTTTSRASCAAHQTKQHNVFQEEGSLEGGLTHRILVRAVLTTIGDHSGRQWSWQDQFDEPICTIRAPTDDSISSYDCMSRKRIAY